MKKTTILVILTAFFGMLPFNRAAAGEKLSLSGSFTTVWNSAYVGRTGIVLYDKPTSVNYLDLNFGENWTFEIWSSTGLGKEKYGSTYADELDLFLTYHNRIEDFKFSLTGAYFFLKDMKDLESDMWILEGEVSYVKSPYFQPYVSVRYFGEISDTSFERGWFGWAGFRSTFPTPIKQVSLTLDASIACSDGAFGKDAGLVQAHIVAGLPIQLGKRVTLTPSILLQTPMGDKRNSLLPYTTENEVVTSVALSVSF